MVTQKGTTWLGQNWDKVLTAVIPAIVTGVVGFFAAIRSIDAEISAIKQDIVSLKDQEKIYPKKDDVAAEAKELSNLRTILDNTVKPSLVNMEEDRNRINAVELRLVKVETLSVLVKEQSDTILSSQLQTIQIPSGRSPRPAGNK